MAVSGFVMNGANKMKPLLKKMVPAPLLRKSRQLLLKRIAQEIGNLKLLPYEKGAYPSGLNLIGPIDSATGLGQSFRLVERVIAELDIPFLIYNYAQNTKNRIELGAYKGKIQEELRYSVNLWHVNPSDFAEAYAMMGREAFDRRYNIAFWLWELEDFPDEWVPYINLLDEIWTPSEFISSAIRKKTGKPVYTIPYYVTAQADTETYGRSYFGLPQDQFLFLMMYDSLSVSERKNPGGTIKAFRTAFPKPRKDVGLVIKVNSADSKELNRIRKQMDDYSNVSIINRNLTKIEVNSLLACVNVLVSLHHAEGFGLVLAEAMLNHVPVIATNWSANIEFMNPDVACMVDYKLKELERDYYPYKKGNRWAEPSIEEAAEYMRKLAEDPLYYQRMAEQSYWHVKAVLSEDAAKKKIKKCIEGIL